MQHLGQGLANRVGRPAQHRSGLCKIPLQEVRFSQHDPDSQLIVARERRRRAQQRGEQFDGGRRLAALERGGGAGNDRLQRCVSHGAEYTKYPIGIILTAIWS